MEKNTAAAKKHFYDWLDNNRPWNLPQCKDNMYAYMELLVEKAAFYFDGEQKFTTDDIRKLQQEMLKLTENLDEHPKDYLGPCACQECCSYC